MITFDALDWRSLAGRSARQEGRPRIAPYTEDLDRRHWEFGFDCAVKIVTCDTDIDIDIDHDIAMDRKYPSYTLAELEKFVAEGKGNPTMVQEIADRKSGASIPKSTPQILGGKAQVKIGRM
jgi:hypothetical protein